MAFSEIELKRCERIVNAYVESRRPPPHIRDQLDISFRINGHSVELFEVRPTWRGKPGELTRHGIFKTTYVKRTDSWKIYWLRADLKWHRYEPDAEVLRLKTHWRFVSVMSTVVSMVSRGRVQSFRQVVARVLAARR